MFALARKLHSMSERWARRRLARSLTSAASGIICATARGMPAAPQSGDHVPNPGARDGRVYSEYCVSCHG